MALLKQQLVRGIFDMPGEDGGPGVFDTVINFLTGNPGEPGQDWVIHADYRALTGQYKDNKVVLKNTGKGANEEVYVGIQATMHSAGMLAGLIVRSFYHFDNTIVTGEGGGDTYATEFYNTEYGSSLGYVSSSNNYHKGMIGFRTEESTVIWENKPPLRLWVYSNKARIIIVIETEDRYAVGYIGQYIRHLTPNEVPFPVCCLTDGYNGGGNNINNLWSTYTTPLSTGDRRNLLFLPRSGGYRCNSFFTPTGWSYNWWMDPTSPVSLPIIETKMMNYPDYGFDQMLFPLYMYSPAATSGYYLLGQLDGVYWAPNRKTTIITEFENDDVTAFPDVDRNEWYSWMALKDEL